MNSVQRITAIELGKILRDGSLRQGVHYQVVDVRDTDYIGGHIPGSLNIPARDIRDDTLQVVKRLQGIPMVIFHCALSQVRGPKSARIYSEAMNALASQQTLDATKEVEEKVQSENQSVYVLTGGFTAWYHQHKNDQSMFEDIDHEIWKYSY